MFVNGTFYDLQGSGLFYIHIGSHIMAIRVPVEEVEKPFARRHLVIAA